MVCLFLYRLQFRLSHARAGCIFRGLAQEAGYSLLLQLLLCHHYLKRTDRVAYFVFCYGTSLVDKPIVTASRLFFRGVQSVDALSFASALEHPHSFPTRVLSAETF